jgi:hypothetical protein
MKNAVLLTPALKDRGRCVVRVRVTTMNQRSRSLPQAD